MSTDSPDNGILVRPIGTIHTSHTIPEEAPLQSRFTSAHGSLEVYPEYSEGLRDIEQFSHLILLYHFNRADGWSLIDKPLSDGVVERGSVCNEAFFPAEPYWSLGRKDPGHS